MLNNLARLKPTKSGCVHKQSHRHRIYDHLIDDSRTIGFWCKKCGAFKYFGMVGWYPPGLEYTDSDHCYYTEKSAN